MTVPRVGGGFGGKAWDSCAVSSAVTLGAFLSGRCVPDFSAFVARIYTKLF